MDRYAAIKFFANIVRSVRELTMPLWLHFRQGNVHQSLSGRVDGVTVSLTAIPSRIGRLWAVIESLMRQTRRPDRIVIALTEEEFPGGMAQLPDSLTGYVQLGVEIVFLPYNLKCHNKYFHALQQYPDSCVVTVDDDCWYDRNTISRLVSLHESHPDAVVSNIARVIDPGHFYSYRMWKKPLVATGPAQSLLALGFGAILYPPHFAQRCADAGHDLFDTGLISRLAPTTDDLWLKAVEMASGIDVACGGFCPNPVTVTGSQKISLRSINKGAENRNDVQWKALDSHFNLINII